MAGERATVLQRTQIGPETTPGTAVPATKRLGATTIALVPQANVNVFAPQGSKFNTITALGREWTNLNINGQASFRDLVYLFNGLIRKTSGVQQGGGPAYLWTWTPQPGAGDQVQTFTVEQGAPGDGGRAYRAAYGLINSLTLNWSRDNVEVSGDGFAAAIEDDHPLSTSATYTLTANASPPTGGNFTLTVLGQTTASIAHDATPAAVQAALEALTNVGADNVEVEATVATGTGKLDTGNNVYTITFKRALAAQPITLTGTFTGLTASGSIVLASGTVGAAPTLVSPVPVEGKQISLYVDDTYGGLGGTKMLRAFGGSFVYGSRFNLVWPVNAALPSYAAHVEVKPTATFTAKFATDNAGMAFLTQLRAGATKFIRFEAVGGIIASTYPYRLRIDMAAKVGAAIPFEDTDGVYQVNVPFTISDDSGWGKAFEASVQADVASL